MPELDQHLVAAELLLGPLEVLERRGLEDDVGRQLHQDPAELARLPQRLERLVEAPEDLGPELARRPVDPPARVERRGLAQVGRQLLGLDRVARHHAERLHVHDEALGRALGPVLHQVLVRQPVVGRVRLDHVEALRVVAQPLLGALDPRRIEVLRQRLVGPGTGPDPDRCGHASMVPRRPFRYLTWYAASLRFRNRTRRYGTREQQRGGRPWPARALQIVAAADAPEVSAPGQSPYSSAPTPRRGEPMSRISTAFVVLLAALVVATLTVTAAPGAGQPLYLNSHASIPARVNDLLHRMTLQEKVGQMDQIVVGKLTRPARQRRLQQRGRQQRPLQTTACSARWSTTRPARSCRAALTTRRHTRTPAAAGPSSTTRSSTTRSTTRACTSR